MLYTKKGMKLKKLVIKFKVYPFAASHVTSFLKRRDTYKK
jgi:hypothetical protein